MNLKRWVLLGIVAACAGVLILALGGAFVRKSKPVGPPPQPSDQAAKTADDKERVIEFYGLTMPYTTENRTIAELKLPHGRDYVNSKLLKAENGTLTLFREEKDDRGKPKTVVVNFLEAEVNKEDKSAFLKDKVDVVLAEGIQLTTKDVHWNPAQNLVSTENPVKITGKGIEVTGVQMEANVKDERATLKKNVKVTLESAEGSAFDLGAGPQKKTKPGAGARPGAAKGAAPTGTAPAAKESPKVVVTCDGELVGGRKPITATFNKNVQVERGASLLTCDILEIRFSEKEGPKKQDAGAKGGPAKPSSKESSVLAEAAKEPESIEKVTATGHVVFKDESHEAFGDEMVWDAPRHCATLIGKNARFRQKDNFIVADTLIYNNTDSSLSVPSGGELTLQTKGDLLLVKTDAKPPKKKTESAPQPMRITWGKDMKYGQNKAVFHDRVKAQQGDNSIEAETLEVAFDDQNRVKGLLATSPGKVVVIYGQRRAEGSRLEWKADAGEASLWGEPTAEVREGENFLACPKIVFHRERNFIECIGSGYLFAAPKKNEAKKGGREKADSPVAIVPGLKAGKGQGPGKIRVTWAERMAFDLNEHKADFYRKVSAARDEMSIAADELQVTFDDANQKVTKVVGVDPKNNLRLEHPQGTGTGSRCEWDSADETASLFGTPRAVVIMKDQGRRLEASKIEVDTRGENLHATGGGSLFSPAAKGKGKTKGESGAMTLSEDLNVTWSDTLDYERAEQKATFTGKVHARSGDKELESDVLTVQFQEVEKKPSSSAGKPEKKVVLKSVRADQHVLLRQGGQQEGTGDQFRWDTQSDSATLEGKPARAKGAVQKRSYQIEGPVINILKLSQKRQDIRVDGMGSLLFPLPRLDLADQDTDLTKVMEGKQAEDVTITWRDKMLFEQSQGRGACYGQTEVIKGTYRVRSRRLEMDLDEQNQLKELRAIEDVYIFEEGRPPGQGAPEKRLQMEATGSKLTWQKAEDKAILVGDPYATIWASQESKFAPRKPKSAQEKEQQPEGKGAQKKASPGAESRINFQCDGRAHTSFTNEEGSGPRFHAQAERIIFSGFLSPPPNVK